MNSKEGLVIYIERLFFYWFDGRIHKDFEIFCRESFFLLNLRVAKYVSFIVSCCFWQSDAEQEGSSLTKYRNLSGGLIGVSNAGRNSSLARSYDSKLEKMRSLPMQSYGSASDLVLSQEMLVCFLAFINKIWMKLFS